jgi:cystathionine beta-lyase/cystathionine gamma-synthase
LPQARYVRYPMLPSHPQHATATEQMLGGSGIVAVDLDLSYDRVERFLGSLRVFTLAESLGGFESLVCHPATMSHASLPLEDRTRLGITPSLVRFSVGVEHSDDLIADIAQALDRSVADD